MKLYQEPLVEVIQFTETDVFMLLSQDKADEDLDWE